MTTARYRHTERRTRIDASVCNPPSCAWKWRRIGHDQPERIQNQRGL